MADVQTFLFGADHEVPNNARLPVVYYPAALDLLRERDPARSFEVLFARNRWTGSWRNGIYPFRHFHPSAHEVLGLARGQARVELGGTGGRLVALRAGDVVVLPAGTAHRKVDATSDLLVVGAYPEGSCVDQRRAGEADIVEACAKAAAVALPARDPVHGGSGPLVGLWRSALQEKPS